MRSSEKEAVFGAPRGGVEDEERDGYVGVEGPRGLAGVERHDALEEWREGRGGAEGACAAVRVSAKEEVCGIEAVLEAGEKGLVAAWGGGVARVLRRDPGAGAGVEVPENGNGGVNLGFAEGELGFFEGCCVKGCLGGQVEVREAEPIPPFVRLAMLADGTPRRRAVPVLQCGDDDAAAG